MPLRPLALLQNVAAPDGVVDGVAALLDVVFDGLKMHRRQNDRGMGVNPLPFDLPGAHAGESPRGLHVEDFELPSSSIRAR